MRHYYDDYDRYGRGYRRSGSYYIPPRGRGGSYGRRAPRSGGYGRSRYGGYYGRGYGRRGYDGGYGAVSDYSRRRRTEYDDYDQYGQYDSGRRRGYDDYSADRDYRDTQRGEGSQLYGGDYDDFDIYGDGRRGGRHAGLVIVLLAVLAVIASVNISIYYVGKVMKKIDYQTGNTIDKSVFEVSASDLTSQLPEDGLTGEELNDYHLKVYRRQILKSFRDDSMLAANDPVTNILFISGESEKSPADIITLISIDSKNKQITFTALMPEIGIAYADVDQPVRLASTSVMGGPLLTVYTVQSLLGVRIDRYVMLDSFGFAEMIDALGGIDMELSDEEMSSYNFCIGLYDNDDPYMSEGGISLNGRQAYLYAKFAGAPDDGRTASRRSMLLYETACALNKAHMSTLMKAVSGAAPYCHTNFTSKQLRSFIWTYFELHSYNVMTDTMPLDNEYTVVSVGGKGMLRFNSIESCRRRLMLGALAFSEEEAIAAGYITAYGDTEQPVSDSDASVPASETDISG